MGVIRRVGALFLQSLRRRKPLVPPVPPATGSATARKVSKRTKPPVRQPEGASRDQGKGKKFDHYA